MNNCLKLNRLFLFLVLCLATVPLWADSDWSFLPPSTIFKPLIGNPREPLTGIVGYLDQTRYEGQVGSTVELVRYCPADQSQWGWGLFGAGYILLDQDGATFPMLDGDWYFGTYFSENCGLFSARVEVLHESTHLGDSLQGIQLPLYNNPNVNYSRENVNGTLSFQPSEFLRLYAGAGIWDAPLITTDTFNSDTFFSFFGTEIYSPDWAIGQTSMRGYLTGSLQWVGDTDVWDKEIQLGLQWKASKTSPRALRAAILFYSGDSQFGQFYNQFDEHLALATYFDF